MIRAVAVMLGGSALYGFSIGAGHSWLYAGRNLIKFPLLIVGTTSLCAFSYFVVARFLGIRLGFVQVQRAVLAIFRDTSMLLAALTPASLFLALTMEPSRPYDISGEAAFQVFSMACIAGCGGLAIHRQARTLMHGHGLRRAHCNLLLASWLLLSLFAGGQCAWMMRPFYGIRGRDLSPVFFRGSAPNQPGAQSFYEAVYDLVRKLD
jgi:hypothetical protein